MKLPRTMSTPPPWLAPVHDRRRIDRQWLALAVLLLMWGGLFFGYWAAINVAVAAVTAVLAHLLGSVLRQAVGLGSPLEARGHVVVLGMLGGLALPVMSAMWWPAVAGAVVGLAAVCVGRAHAVRTHPVAVLGVVMLGVWLAGHAPWLDRVMPSQPAATAEAASTAAATDADTDVMSELSELSGLPADWLDRARSARVGEPVGAVLEPAHVLVGDVRHVGEPAWGPLSWWRWEVESGESSARPWLERTVVQQQRHWLTNLSQMQDLLGEGALPPLEDVLMGAVPGGVGATGVGLLLVVAVYLAYRRLSSGVMLLAAGVSAVAALLAMPVRGDDEAWMLAGQVLWGSGPASALMWLAYALLGTSLLWCVVMLAPMGMPMGGRGRLVYGVLVGAGGVAALWWIAEPWSAYVAVAAAGAIARPLDAVR